MFLQVFSPILAYMLSLYGVINSNLLYQAVAGMELMMGNV